MARNKKPKTSLIGSNLGGKYPKAETPPNSNNHRPSWRISKIEMEGPFGWRELDLEKLEEVRAKLSDFESSTWNEILVVNKHRNHTVAVSEIISQAQSRLEAIQLGDIDELVSLRLSGPERVWGIREAAVMLVLWWDPDHQIYPSPKKHT